MRPGSTTSLLNQKEQASSANTPILHPPKSESNFFSAGKIMATVFWDSKGIIHLDFLTGQKTINAQYYSTLLNEKVKAGNPLKAKKKAGFSLLPPRQRSFSHCSFNDGNSTETEVG
jgi:hypothetical protein